MFSWMNKQQLPIKNLCTQDWDAMEGSERQRLCRACDRQVHNLSAMTRGEAQAVLLRRSQGQRLCIRYSAAEDGEILFQRQGLIPAGLRTRQVALRATLAAAALAVVVETPGCVPAGPVSGAIAARVAAEEVAEQLGAAGSCAISLEPLLPLSLALHAAACQAPVVAAPVVAVASPPGEAVPVPKSVPVETAPPATPAQPVPTSTAPARQRSARAAKKAAPKPTRPPHVLMGDVLMGY